jgi:hypothetical protein
MFKPLWRRLFQSSGSPLSAARRRRERPRNQVRLQLEHLENRITPTDILANASGHVLTIVKLSGADNITLVEGPTFGELTLSVPAGDTINGHGNTFTTSTPITTVKISLGTGTDTLTLNGTTTSGGNGPINLSGGLSISGSGGDKTLSLTDVNLLGNANLNIALTGTGTETSIFVGVNVGASASISHPGVGDTSVTISAPLPAGPNNVDNWGSLSINNGIGNDNNAIGDTNFAGNLIIHNGPGKAGDTTGGSITNISATNDQNLANIGGNVVVTTASGQSETELYDYNVHGNVTINTGKGIAGQANQNYVGLENIQTSTTSGIPVIVGKVNITGWATAMTTGPGLVVDFGTDVQDPASTGGGAKADLPLTILGGLSINVTGAGSANVTLNDLNVPSAGTTVTLGATTKDDTVTVQAGTGLTSVYQSFTLTSNATGNNTVNVQDQAGTVLFGGPVVMQFNAGNTTVNAGADATHTTGLTNAQIELFSKVTVKGHKGGNNTFFGVTGTAAHPVLNTNILSILQPDLSNFTPG